MPREISDTFSNIVHLARRSNGTKSKASRVWAAFLLSERVGTAAARPRPVRLGLVRAAPVRAFLGLAFTAALLNPLPASAATSAKHEITANWVGNPADAPFGVPVIGEWHISTNDANDPEASDPVDNVRLALTATNGAFASLPAVCKTKSVTPVSAISANGTQLLCNLGTITEGTANVIQAPVRPNGVIGSVLSLSGVVTSDSAAAPTAPTAPPGLPITGSHGMDLALSAPNQNYQQNTVASRSGGNRPSVMVDYGVSMTAGSVPGPSTYTFTVDIAVSVPGQLPGLQWEGCAPVDNSAQATGIPYSAANFANRTNAPTCSISGSGTHYTVTLSGLDYSLQHVPSVDSLGNAIPSTTNFIAAGQLIFSYTTPITQSTGVTFTATPSQFTFIDNVTLPETNTSNNVSGTSLVLPGSFAISWQGGPTVGRSPWDAGLWAAPGTAQNLTLPWPPAGTSTNPGPYSASVQPLASSADSVTWSTYSGAGGADMAGSCSMVQNPAAFTPRWADFVGIDGAFYTNMTTAHLWYRTDAIDTKTETCGEPVGVPGSPWTAAPLPAGCATQTAAISPAYSDDQCIVSLPAGVTAVKMTWNPAVDKQFHHTLRVWGYVPTTAPIGAESWTVGAFNAPYNVSTVFPGGWPTLNNYINISTNTSVYANIPGSTYGPNTNGQRDAMRIQGPNGVITKTTPSATAEPGVPVTFNLTAEADLSGANPPNQTFTVTDTLPTGMSYVVGSGTPTPSLSVNGSGQQVLSYTFTNVPANTPRPITYQAQTAANSTIAPGTVLTNTAQIDVPGDNRPAAVRQVTASVTVPNSGATTLRKSVESSQVSFYGDSSAWNLTINSQDPTSNPYTDTIDILPSAADGRGTNISGTYTITGVTAPAGATIYYSTAPIASLSNDPRAASNGGTPGTIAGNTVGWSTTAVANPTAIRVIGPALAPGAAQKIRIAFSVPAGTSCNAPLPTDNKPGQKLVNSANTIAGHTALPMLSSTTATIGACVPEQVDFGDAPDSYGTLLASNGARHSIPGYNEAAKTAPLMLGSRISAEPNGQPDANAALDTYDDGLVPTSLVLTTGATTASAVVTAINAKGTPATIAGWIDFNGNGTFDAGERAQVTVPANTTTATPFTLNWSGLSPIPAGFNSFARFRIATSAADVANPTGVAADGEIEDYLVPIKQPVGCTTNPSVFNTAINAAGTGVLAPGSRDRNWEVGLGTPAGGPASVPSWIQAYVTGNASPVNWANSPFGNADWTSYFSNANQGAGNVDEYHRYRFTLDGAVDPSTFALGIDFYSDNSVWEVYVNGQAQSGLVAGLPQNPTDPYFYAGFKSANRAQLVLNRNWRTGPNEIVVQVRSAPPLVGFLAQVTSTSLCPIQVGITKSAEPPGLLTPGGTVTYTVEATNTGAVAAPNTVVSDPLPPGIVSGSWTCSAVSGAVCPNASGTLPLNQTIATFPGGGVVIYTITGQVAASPPASITNTATATPPGAGTCYPGNGLGPCTASVSNPPVPVIAIAKSTTATQAIPGGPLVYTVTVQNVGSVDAAGTTVSDPVPTGLGASSWTCAASAGAFCPNASGSGAINEMIDTFPPGGQLVYTVTATVDAHPPASIANTATTTPPDGGICGDGSAPPCASTVVLPAAPQVSVSKTADPPGALAPGGTVTYVITVSNGGSVAAPDTLVSDAFPDGIAAASWTCAASGGAACPNASSGGLLTPPAELLSETIATFPPGASLTYTITATVAANPPADIVNTAVATPPGGVCLPANSLPPCMSTVTNPLGLAQITIVKVPTALDGTPFAFTSTAPAPDDAFTLSSGSTLMRTFNAAPGVVSVREGATAGWVLTDIICVNQAGSATFTYTGATTNPTNGFERGDDTANITVGFGDKVTCTYTNAPTALPTLAKYFNTDPPSDPPPPPPVVMHGGTALLTFVISNTAASATAQSGLAFTDTLPSGLVLANGSAPPSALVGTNTCGGTVTATAGTVAISLAGGTVAIGADCRFTVRVASAP